MSRAMRRAKSKRERKQARRAAVLGLLVAGASGSLGASVLIAAPAQAASFQVTNLNDSGAGSLRAAIAAANAADGADTITFAPGASSGVIELTSGELEITDDLTLTGPGSGKLTIDGGGRSRVLNMVGTAGIESVVVSGLTVTGGLAPTWEYEYYDEIHQDLRPGGAVYGDFQVDNVPLSYFDHKNHSVTLVDLVVSDSKSDDGGGMYVYGADTVDVIDSVFDGNSATDSGYGGGISVYAGQLRITDSTISNNHAADGGGGISVGNAVITGSTISNNTVGGSFTYEGEEYAFGSGGGISASGELTLSNVTIVANQASAAGGGLSVGGVATLSGVTIAGNSAGGGGGVDIWNDDGGLSARSSIFAGNTAAASSARDLSAADGAFVDLGFSLVQSTPAAGTIAELVVGSNIFGQDPQLGELADNGGPTMTMLPAVTSPVIDKGKSFGLSTDQRGESRPADLPGVTNAIGGDGSDMGAVERTAGDGEPASVVSNTTLPTIGGTAQVGSVLTATGTGSWTPADVTTARQWLRNGTPVPGATGSSYRLAAADMGARIALRVVASKSGFTPATAESLPTPPVVRGVLAVAGVPTVKGKAKVGKKLKVTSPSSTPAAPVRIQWLRNGKPIAGATRTSYKLKKKDKRKRLSVQLTYVLPGYGNAIRHSAPTGKVRSKR